MSPRVWYKVWAFLILGYVLIGRSFAYLGLPSIKLFISEIVLGSFIFLKVNRWLRPWTSWLLGQGSLYLIAIAWSLVLFMLYGILQALRGLLLLGHDPIVTLQTLVFNVYPLYIFLGLWIGQSKPDVLRFVIRWLAWANAIYGMAYILYLGHLDLSLPWAPGVLLFGQPGGSALALLGLLSLEPRLARVKLLLALNFFVLLGIQVRGEWLTFAIGFVIWLALYHKLKRLIVWSIVIISVFFLMYTLDIRIPSPFLRGGEISIHGVIARIIAPIDPEAAADLIGKEAYDMAGTIIGWRIPWWLSIWNEVHRNNSSTLLGLGYGYPLYTFLSIIPEDVRTPHNVFFYALGYGGWLGVIFFFVFQISLGLALSKVAVQSKNIFGFILWAGSLGGAFFGNFFETPFGAIPFYLLIGYSLAPLTPVYALGNYSYLLPAARR